MYPNSGYKYQSDALLRTFTKNNLKLAEVADRSTMQFSKPQAAHAAEPPSAAPEDSWPCGHGVAIRDINRAHELMTQLHAVLLQFPAGSTWSRLGGNIIKDILKLTTSALAALQSSERLAGEKRKAVAASTTTWGTKDHEPDGRKIKRQFN